MKAIISASLMLLAATLFSCQQDELAQTVTYCYAETGCADPWDRDNSETAQAEIIRTYLKEQGVKTQGVSVVKSPEDFVGCYACHCTTGRRVEVELSQADVTALLGLTGFWEEDPWTECEGN